MADIQYDIGQRVQTRFTENQFMMMVWQMSQKDLHYRDFKRIYAEELKTLWVKTIHTRR